MPYPKGCLLQPGKASLSMDVMVQRRPSLRTGYPIRFPERDRIIHASTLDTIDWKTEGTHHERDIKRDDRLLLENEKRECFRGLHSLLGQRLYHIADESSTPGIKLWSYGVAGDKEWSMLSTPTGSLT